MSFIRPAFMLRLFACLLAIALFPVASATAQSVFFSPTHNAPGTLNFTADLDIDTAGELVLGVEVFISFDSSIIQLDSIGPGSWTTGAAPSFYFYDYTTPGTSEIHFSMAFLGTPVGGAGTLAICYFTALDVGTSPLEFTSLVVRDGDNETLPATHSTGDDIFIDLLVGTELTTFGEIRLLYR